VPGVEGRELSEGTWELKLVAGADPRSLLPALMAAGPLSLFAANRPSLYEIFLSAVARHRQEVGQ